MEQIISTGDRPLQIHSETFSVIAYPGVPFEAPTAVADSLCSREGFQRVETDTEDTDTPADVGATEEEVENE